jgi:hypothetical protein
MAALQIIDRSMKMNIETAKGKDGGKDYATTCIERSDRADRPMLGGHLVGCIGELQC